MSDSGQACVTLWSCQLCSFSSWLGHTPNTPDEAIIRTIHEVHTGMSPDCPAGVVTIRPATFQAAHISYQPPTKEEPEL